jgi:serine/threonine protein kinase
VTIPNGTRLGPYDIVAPLGAGGMGEVYRATDTRLRRAVALKILPQAFVSDRSRAARFEQEARATAALRHPNVLTIHDFGTDPMPYLVTELLEGETLADILSRGPVPVRRAIGWSLQILRAIGAAHAADIIHRDVKPANIFIGTDGTVKVLDFGLAKVLDQHESLNDLPTAPLSDPGTIVGTAPYMSPEQIRGDDLDARSDIFSFAVVLHEMLTGKTPFARNSKGDTMSAILRDEAPRLETPPHPPALAETILRCLDKSPEGRFHSAHDLAIHLELVDQGGSGSSAALASPSFAPPQLEQVTYRSGNILHARFAPNGDLVYSASWEDREPEVFLSLRGMPEARPLGIQGSVHSISPSGELAVSLRRRSEAGFISSGTLARVPIAGGAPRIIAHDIHEADWSSDGRQLAIARRSEHGFRIEYPIGQTLYESGSWFSSLRISPSGDQLAFLEHPFEGDNFGHVSVVDLNGQARQVTDDLFISWGLAWHPHTGEIWYSAAPVNARPGQTVMIYGVSPGGKPREVFASLGATFLHDIAADGTVLMTHETYRRRIVGHVDGTDRDLSWFDWSFPTCISADGRTLLFEEQGIASAGRNEIYVRSTGGGPAVRLDQGRARDLSSDGTRVLALTNEAPEKVILIPTEVGSVHEIPVIGIDHFVSARFLPGGNEIVVTGSRGSEGARLWRVSVQGGEAQPLSGEGFAAWFFLALSPDGEWVAAIGPDQVPLLYPVHAEEIRAVKGAQAADFPVYWPHEHHLFVCRREEKRSLVFDLNLETGERTLVREMAPLDPAGVHGVFPIYFAKDPANYVFGYRLLLSSMFVASGIR